MAAVLQLLPTAPYVKDMAPQVLQEDLLFTAAALQLQLTAP